MEDKKRILVIDDERLVREIVTRIAQKRGAEVVALPDGKDTRKVLEEKDFQLAVVDLLMPETSGWDVVSMIRTGSRNKDMPIIILSGTKISEEEKSKLLLTVNAVVNKTTFSLQGFETVMDSCSIL